MRGPVDCTLTVTYKRGAANITNGVVAGTFTLQDVPPAGTRNITVRIQARPGTPVNATLSRKLTLTSATTDTKDAVKATVTCR